MIYAIAAVLVLIADQAVKYWTTGNIVLDAIGEECKQLIPGVIHMTNVHNYGAAFSILENAKWLLIGVSVIFIIGIIVLISMEIIYTPFGKWTSVLVLAGALGNCIDRVLYGYVVDMFELELFTFAVFNVADIFITVCGILFCIHVIVHREPAEVIAANEPERVQRRRAEREARIQEDPYAAIPRRGEHRNLEDELRLSDPEDPFAEWGFGDTVEEPAPRRARRAPVEEEEEPTPRRVRRAPVEEEEEPAPRRIRKAPVEEEEEPAPRRVRKAPVEEEEPAPQRVRKAPAAEEDPAPRPARRPSEELDFGASGTDEFSLEDILSEFRDY